MILNIFCWVGAQAGQWLCDVVSGSVALHCQQSAQCMPFVSGLQSRAGVPWLLACLVVTGEPLCLYPQNTVIVAQIREAISWIGMNNSREVFLPLVVRINAVYIRRISEKL